MIHLKALSTDLFLQLRTIDHDISIDSCERRSSTEDNFNIEPWSPVSQCSVSAHVSSEISSKLIQPKTPAPVVNILKQDFFTKKEVKMIWTVSYDFPVSTGPGIFHKHHKDIERAWNFHSVETIKC